MHNDQLFSFTDFKKANNDPATSGIDYVQAVYATTPLHFDFLLHYAQLMSPVIEIVDDRAFIGELFDANRYLDLIKTTQDMDRTQYWMNLLEITGLFDNLTTEQAIALAQIISQCWNSNLLTKHGNSCGEARYICDTDSGEVFVTIARWSLADTEEQ